MTYKSTLERLQSILAAHDEIYQDAIARGLPKYSAEHEAAERLTVDAPDFLRQLIDTMIELERLKEGVKEALEIPEYNQNDDDRAVQMAWNSGFNHARLKFRTLLIKHKRAS